MSEVTNSLGNNDKQNIFTSMGVAISETSIAELARLKQEKESASRARKLLEKEKRDRRKKEKEEAQKQDSLFDKDSSLSAQTLVVPEDENTQIQDNTNVVHSTIAVDQSILEDVEIISEESIILNSRIEDLIVRSLNDYGSVNLDFIIDNWVLQQESDEIRDRFSAFESDRNGVLTKEDYRFFIVLISLEKELLFIEPKLNNELSSYHHYVPLDTEDSSYTFVTKDEFLSGSVRFKLAEYETNGSSWGDSNEDYLSASIDLLKENDKEWLPLSEINLQLGEFWIPQYYLQDFARQLLDEGDLTLRLESHNNEFSLYELGYVVSENNYNNHSYKNRQQWGLSHMKSRGDNYYNVNVFGSELLEHALNGTSPVYHYKNVVTGKTEIDQYATAKAGMKIEEMGRAWMNYVLVRPNILEHLERIYNNVYNLDVLRSYDGSHLKFSNMQNGIKLHSHQKDAIWQMVQQNGGMVDHIVGAGKTLVMAGLSDELQRLGVARRVMIICKKSTVVQIGKEILRAYPDKKILIANNERWDIDGNYQDTSIVKKRYGTNTKKPPTPILNDFGDVIGYYKFGDVKDYEQRPYIDKGLYLSDFLYDKQRKIYYDPPRVVDGKLKYFGFHKVATIFKDDIKADLAKETALGETVKHKENKKGDIYNSSILDSHLREVVGRGEFFIDETGKVNVIRSQEDISKAYSSLYSTIRSINFETERRFSNAHDRILSLENNGFYQGLLKRYDDKDFYKVTSLSDDKIQALGLDDLIYRFTNRSIFINQVIPSSNDDIVLLTHQQFKELPSDLYMEESIIRDQLEMMEADLHSWKSATGKKISARKINGLEKRMETTQTRLKNILSKQKKNKYDIPFSGLNIDHLMVDESQVFKNLVYTTRFENVAGLGNSKGSDISFHLLLCIRSLQEKNGGDKGVTFLTGTPLSNSLTECYTLFRYLRPTMLYDRNMANFDNWIRTFSKASSEFEINILGKVASRYRFRDILKMPELTSMYNSFSHVVTDDEFHVDKPLLIDKREILEPTMVQEACLSELINGVASYDLEFFGKVLSQDKQNSGLMLQATSLAKKISLDVRMLNLPLDTFGRDLVQSDSSKIDYSCGKIYDVYKKTHEHLGTQLVFLDISTPKSDAEKKKLRSVGLSTFSMYDEIKATLISMGISKDEIAFIHDADASGEKGDRQRMALFEKFNNGDIRVLLGSTEKMGTGVNVQKRCCAVHHIDLPWTFALYEQRNGRAVRQGNIIAPLYGGVENYVYGVKKTLDPFTFDLIQTKCKTMAQARSNKYVERVLNEGDIDGDGGMSARVFAASLLEDPSLLELKKVEKEYATLEREQNIIMGEHNRLSVSIRQLESTTIPKMKFNRDNIAKDIPLSKDLFTIDAKEKVYYTFTTNQGTILSDHKDIQKFFHDKVKENIKKPSCKLELGRIGDFRVLIEKTHDSIPAFLKMSFVSKITDRVYLFREGKVYENTQAVTLYNMPYNALKTLPEQLIKLDKEVVNYDTRLNNERLLFSTLDLNKHTVRLANLHAEIIKFRDKVSEVSSSSSFIGVDTVKKEVLKVKQQPTRTLKTASIKKVAKSR